MRPALRRLFLLALAHDAEAALRADGRWRTRCLHCRSTLEFDADGTPLGHGTLEHVVPQAWFGKRAAAALTREVGDAANDARNLALACAGCNHDKGKGPDARGPNDERAREVVAALLARRLERWAVPREPGEVRD
ncbi:HNH endonuclease [Cognatilysobacter tabacisoli]|uniref:HNH endonuclease n=1 Tax=Cognatilysobacter tabacisoli TaxID=2315424 RepID=UPI000E6B168C|nr:HNH endonuclease [Lysobacter tabacisoli]